VAVTFLFGDMIGGSGKGKGEGKRKGNPVYLYPSN